MIIVNSCQCVGQHQLQVFTVRAQKACFVYNVVGSHTCGFWAAYAECTLHLDYASESFISQYLIPNKTYDKPCDP